jgi:hypothetical protein
MTSRDPSALALRKAVGAFMDTGNGRALRTALADLPSDVLLRVASDFGGHEWIALLEQLPTARRRELQTRLAPAQLNEVREALLLSFPGEDGPPCGETEHRHLRRYLSPAPLLEIGRWSHWAETFKQAKGEDSAQYVYFTTPEGRLLARASLPELASASSRRAGRPRMERPVHCLSISTRAMAAWRVLRLGAWSELPVVDEDRRVVGIVYRERLARALIFERLCVRSSSLTGRAARLKAWLRRLWA